MRFPSYLFGIALLINVGVLAYLLLPASPYVIPSAILLLASSTRFWESNLSAMLDTGAALFSTLAVTALFAALGQPRWWYLVAVAIVLGALQKAPVPLAFVAGMLLVLAATRGWHKIELGRSLSSIHFRLSALIVLVGVLFWPALQWIRHGALSLEQAYIDQMIERFSPFDTGKQPRRSWLTTMVNGEPVTRIVAMLALLWLPWGLRRLEFLGLPLFLLGYGIVVALTSGPVSPRYSLLFLPMLSASLAAVIMTTATYRKWLPALLIATVSAVSLGPFKSVARLDILESDQARYVPLLREIGASLAPAETFITCRLKKGEDRIYAGAVSYYASAGRPFHRLDSPGDLGLLEADGVLKPPYRGLCSKSELVALRAAMPDLQVIGETGDYLHWASRGARSRP